MGDLASQAGGEIRTGPFGTQLHKSDYVDDPAATPVVMPKDMSDGKIDSSAIARVDAEAVERLSPHILSKGDIVLGRRGEIGRRAWTSDTEEGWLCGTGSMRISVNGSEQVRPRYLFYFFGLNQTIGWLKGHSVGATMSNLSAGVVQQLPVRYPPLALQDAIVEVLDSLDTLIENNRRRIEILEEMARLLYREWFVHFRFPGHGDVELVDSEIGLIPEGWEASRLDKVCSLVMGQSPKSEYCNDIGEGLPFHQGVSGFGSRFPTHTKWTMVDKRVAEPGDILFSVRAPVGRINVAPDCLVVGRGLSAIRALDGYQNFLLMQLKDKFAEEDSMGGGTIFNAVTKKDMESILLLKPDCSLAESFEAVSAPMADLIANLSKQNRALREARDLLLPRLVSGELDVSELDFELEALGA